MFTVNFLVSEPHRIYQPLLFRNGFDGAKRAISPFSRSRGAKFYSWKFPAKGVETKRSVQNECRNRKPKTNLRSLATVQSENREIFPKPTKWRAHRAPLAASSGKALRGASDWGVQVSAHSIP
jgi:hypothetical protein